MMPLFTVFDTVVVALIIGWWLYCKTLARCRLEWVEEFDPWKRIGVALMWWNVPHWQLPRSGFSVFRITWHRLINWKKGVVSFTARVRSKALAFLEGLREKE